MSSLCQYLEKQAKKSAEEMDDANVAAMARERGRAAAGQYGAGHQAAKGAIRGGFGGALGGAGTGAGFGGMLGATKGLTESKGGIANRAAHTLLGAATGAGVGAIGGAALGAPVGALAGGISGGVSGHKSGRRSEKANQKVVQQYDREEKEKKASLCQYLEKSAKAGEPTKRELASRKGLGQAVGIAGGGTLGGALGSAASHALSSRVNHPAAQHLAGAMPIAGALAGAHALRGLGGRASLALGRAADRAEKSKQERREKMSSLFDYSELFQKVASGELGVQAQASLAGICIAQNQVLEVDKVASYEDTQSEATEESEGDSRKRRLAELLKKREHSGTAHGSASPHPTKGE